MAAKKRGRKPAIKTQYVYGLEDNVDLFETRDEAIAEASDNLDEEYVPEETIWEVRKIGVVKAPSVQKPVYVAG